MFDDMSTKVVVWDEELEQSDEEMADLMQYKKAVWDDEFLQGVESHDSLLKSLAHGECPVSVDSNPITVSVSFEALVSTPVGSGELFDDRPVWDDDLQYDTDMDSADSLLTDMPLEMVIWDEAIDQVLPDDGNISYEHIEVEVQPVSKDAADKVFHEIATEIMWDEESGHDLNLQGLLQHLAPGEERKVESMHLVTLHEASHVMFNVMPCMDVLGQEYLEQVEYTYATVSRIGANLDKQQLDWFIKCKKLQVYLNNCEVFTELHNIVAWDSKIQSDMVLCALLEKRVVLQPWPPPEQFGMQGKGVRLRPLPWPSFMGHALFIHLQHSQPLMLSWSVDTGMMPLMSFKCWKHCTELLESAVPVNEFNRNEAIVLFQLSVGGIMFISEASNLQRQHLLVDLLLWSSWNFHCVCCKYHKCKDYLLRTQLNSPCLQRIQVSFLDRSTLLFHLGTTFHPEFFRRLIPTIISEDVMGTRIVAVHAQTASAMWLLLAITHLSHEEFQFSFEIAKMMGTVVMVCTDSRASMAGGALVQELVQRKCGGCMYLFDGTDISFWRLIAARSSVSNVLILSIVQDLATLLLSDGLLIWERHDDITAAHPVFHQILSCNPNNISPWRLTWFSIVGL